MNAFLYVVFRLVMVLSLDKYFGVFRKAFAYTVVLVVLVKASST